AEAFERVERPVREQMLVPLRPRRESRAALGLLAGLIAPREQAARERTERHVRDVELRTERDHVPLVIALEQVVVVLDDRRLPVLVQGPQLGRTEVADAPLIDQAELRSASNVPTSSSGGVSGSKSCAR